MRWFRRHRHEWKKIKVDWGEFVLFGGGGTRIYETCACGAHRSYTINGHWSPEELT